MLKGIAASAGYAIAKVYKLEHPVVNIVKKEGQDVEAEIAKFDAALVKTVADIEAIKAQAEGKLSEEELAVFDAHLMMAQDPDLVDGIKAMINDASYTIKVEDPSFTVAPEEYAYVSFLVKNDLSKFGSTSITFDIFEKYNTTTKNIPQLLVLLKLAKTLFFTVY